jgi:esterase/lipase superfamily enzyme
MIAGNYSDEEKQNKKFDYLYAYNKKPRTKDRFESRGKIGFEKALLAELVRLREKEGVNTPKVGIYLHGFNNDYHDSLDELFDIEEKLGQVYGHDPVIIGFSWPSSGKTGDYLSDREKARDSVGAFTRFLQDINKLATKNEQDCFSTTFCIAHSMGNYLLRKGLEYLSDSLGTPTGRMLFDETIMLAPDLSSHDIELNGKGRYIAEFSRRVHVYYSKHDRALKASSSKRFGGNRLGRHGPDDYHNLPANVIAVDAKKYANKEAIKTEIDRAENQVSVHSSHRYHTNILIDIKQALSSIDRGQISGREPVLVNGEAMNNHYKLV